MSCSILRFAFYLSETFFYLTPERFKSFMRLERNRFFFFLLSNFFLLAAAYPVVLVFFASGSRFIAERRPPLKNIHRFKSRSPSSVRFSHSVPSLAETVEIPEHRWFLFQPQSRGIMVDPWCRSLLETGGVIDIFLHAPGSILSPFFSVAPAMRLLLAVIEIFPLSFR